MDWSWTIPSGCIGGTTGSCGYSCVLREYVSSECMYWSLVSCRWFVEFGFIKMFIDHFRVVERQRRNNGSSEPWNWLHWIRAFDIIMVSECFSSSGQIFSFARNDLNCPKNSFERSAGRGFGYPTRTQTPNRLNFWNLKTRNQWKAKPEPNPITIFKSDPNRTLQKWIRSDLFTRTPEPLTDKFNFNPRTIPLAEFLSSASRHSEACEQRIRAAELSPTDYSLVVSAATALRLLEKKQEAEKWYRLVS